MTPKLKQMDAMVEIIHNEIAKQDAERIKQGKKPTLFVLLGDHGMNDGGNHGGSSYPEIAAVMMFMSPARTIKKKELRTIMQVDLVPTLTTLFGVPIPRNNVGKLIEDLIEDLSGTILSCII
jgi:ethanolaminephosphotransferase